MRPTSSKRNEEEDSSSIKSQSNNIEASISSSLLSTTSQPASKSFEISWPRLPSCTSGRRSNEWETTPAQKISKKKKEQRLNSAVFYFTLLLTQQIFVSPIKNQFCCSNKLQQSPKEKSLEDLFIQSFEDFNSKMFSYDTSEQQYNDGSRELFDPAVGKFQTAFGQNDFFAPRFRWRNDAELAAYAWKNQEKSQINMMMTENRVPTYGPTPSIKTPRDPSLLDYEAIDVSWRNDIEHEKNRVSEYTSQQRDMYDAQYERDLQVLHEKGYIAPFTAEESNRYEELSKAQFADFYNSVARPTKGSSFQQSNILPSSSRLTNFSTTPSTSVFRQSFYSETSDLQQSDCQRSDDGYHSNNDSGFNSNSDDERNGDEHSNHGVSFQEYERPLEQPQRFENLTLSYQPFSETNETLTLSQTTPSNETSPVLGDYTVNGPETLETSLELDEEEYLKYVTNQQVLEDISASATEQSFEAANEVLARVQREHEDSHISVDITPFDEPIPFLDDDFFLNQGDNVAEDTVTESSNEASNSVSPTHDYRMYGKLIPEMKSEVDKDEESDDDYELDEHASSSSDSKGGRRRGRQSKDNDLVKKHDLPATAEELAAMSHKALQILLKDPQLTETQKSLIKRIRRRGRNKEAARKCRERRIVPTASETSSTPLSFESSTSSIKLIQRPFIVYPPSRTAKVA